MVICVADYCFHHCRRLSDLGLLREKNCAMAMYPDRKNVGLRSEDVQRVRHDRRMNCALVLCDRYLVFYRNLICRALRERSSARV
jgi:hypothetical protein